MSADTPVSQRPPSTRRLTRTFVACLSLIGALAVVKGGYVLYATGAMMGDASRINLTGRQRALTQALALSVERSARHPDGGASTLAALNNWDAGWKALAGDDPAHSEVAPDATQRERLLRLAPLTRRVRDLIGASPISSDAAAARLDSVSVASDSLVREIDSVVNELVAEERLDRIQLRALQVAFTLLLLVLLVVLTRFAMRPAIRAVGQLIRTQHADSVTLREQAATLREQAATLETNAHVLEAQNERLDAQRSELMDSQSKLLATSETLMSQRSLLEEHARDLSRFGMTLDAMPDLVIMVGIDGRLLYHNPAAATAIPGIDRHRGLRLLRCLAKDSARVLRSDVLPLVMERGIWHGELMLRASGDEPFPVQLTLIAQRDRYGFPEVFVAVAHDLREERRLTNSLAEREALHRTVIDSLAEAVVVQDRDGRVIAYNESATRVLGVTAEQLLERSENDERWRISTIDGVPLPPSDHPVTHARRHGERVDGQLIRLEVDGGAPRELSVNVRPMFLNDLDDTPAAVATFTDVTAQRALHREMETLSIVVRQSDYAVIMTDATTAITWVNSAFEQLTGYSAAEAIGHRPGRLLQGVHSSPETVARIRGHIENEEGSHAEMLNYRKDGTPYWVELTITPLHDAAGVLTGFVGMSRDITARRKADRERQTLAAALAVAADGVAIVDSMGTLEFVNQAFARQAGGPPEDLVGRVWLSTLFNEDEARFISRDGSAELTSLGFWHGEVHGKKLSGETFPQEVSLTLLPQGGMVAVVRDISERKAAEDRLKFLSTRDELTGLLNRRGFMHAAHAVIREARQSGRTCALLYGDLDSFKLINDKFGHPVGDQALQEVGKLLSSTFRSTDLIARLGGDEFTVLVCDVGREELDRIMQRLDEAVATQNAARASNPATAWTLGVSLGVAFAEPGDVTDIDSLLRQADAAQYIRKSLRKATPRAA